MNTEVATTEPQEPTTATAIIQVIERAASNPDVDIEKMERLLGMQERILDRQAEADAAAAMTRVQAKLPTVARDARNSQTNSNYSRLETIAKAIRPVYTAEGFSLTFSQEDSPKEDHIRVVGILRHQSGYKERHHLDVPLDSAGIKGNVNKTPTHATGSTYSYGRRYLTCMIFDVATGDDDDGNAAGGQPPISEQQAADLRALIEEVGADEAKFLKYIKADSIEDIRARAYSACVKMLEAKRKQHGTTNG